MILSMSQSSFLKLILSNSKAFSLVELLVATVLNGIVILAMGTVYFQVTQTQQNMLEEKKGLDTALRAGYYLQNLLTQAVGLSWAGPNNLNMASGTGQLRQYYWDSNLVSAQDVHTLGIFWREAAGSAQTRSLFRATGLYFQPPTPTTSGVLFIDTGDKLDAGGNPLLAPEESDISFDSFVSFRISQPSVRVGGSLAAVRIQYVIRTFRSSNAAMRWCPAANMGIGPCVYDGVFKDHPVTLNILFRNNSLGPATNSSVGVERLFDQLYFFATQFPLGYDKGGL